MKKFLLVAAGLAMAAGANAAMAADQGWYVSGALGASLLPALNMTGATSTAHSSFNAGYAYGGAVGYDMGNGWRYELDSVHQLSGLDRIGGTLASGHLQSTSLMANATYDLPVDWIVTPYVGAGVGFANVGGAIDGLSGGDVWEPAYQVEAGLRKNLGDNYSLFTEYRFTQSEAAKFADPALSLAANQHFDDHQLMVGVSYRFNP
ncbi:MAG: porin family protein [Alphaproteobacteria bacterium]|nr:outer membrane beta-barrel protein [Alphaproteobacteria bacterium]MDE2112943.1 porin family protein [Alphaproteobacteria bacterium]MDE2495917.1 porin family protein [Alphaproteobacteria bacterium]